MKKILLMSLTVLLAPIYVQADICIKQKAHTDGYYYGGVVNPAEDSVNEMWIGNNKMAYHAETRIIIVDMSNGELLFINKIDSTYARTSLPLDWKNLVPEPLAGRLEMFRTKGMVKETGETKKIGEWECKTYEINSWIPYEGTKYNERDTKIWVTTDLPAVSKVYDALRPDLLKLRNYGDEFINELKKIEGFQVYEKTMRYERGLGIRSIEEVIEVMEKKPPKGVYSVPSGFTEKEKLSMQDLQG